MPESYLQYIYLKIYCYEKYWLCVIRVCVYTHIHRHTQILCIAERKVMQIPGKGRQEVFTLVIVCIINNVPYFRFFLL